ncbi:hypothetical protein X805_28690 [Sphaerotilus natans subsp. natans DSM 6575]|uniref:Uncharacterized protein n=1 Tax=Sphaerotilus natans subsp. natans DSM 6575 TaxID=1286631 RepID=A0A059KJ76_9BURK|nr:hypothetical protein X805_28690 [Sphaerotilus natans subsp. natans DSM 6575]
MQMVGQRPPQRQRMRLQPVQAAQILGRRARLAPLIVEPVDRQHMAQHRMHIEPQRRQQRQPRVERTGALRPQPLPRLQRHRDAVFQPVDQAQAGSGGMGSGRRRKHVRCSPSMGLM